MASKNNKQAKTKSERNASTTDLPDVKTNASTAKTAVHRQDSIDDN